MKEMIIFYWFIFKPFRYLTYKKRLQQGMSKDYSYEFVSERTHQEIMAYLRTIKIEEKRFLQLQEENADIVNDKVLQDICDMGMGSPIDRLKDDEPFDEEKYLDNAKKNIDVFKKKCYSIPRSELRKDSNIKFKENPKDIPPDNFDFKDKKYVEVAYQNLKNKYMKKGS